jgi:hypothetical protein
MTSKLFTPPAARNVADLRLRLGDYPQSAVRAVQPASKEDSVGPILDLDEFPFVPMPTVPFPPHEKVPAIASYVGNRPAAWVDDVVVPEAVAWARAREAPTILIEVDHREGLQRAHVDQLIE